jgi:hypothetical protein
MKSYNDYIDKTIRTIQNNIFLIDEELKGTTVDAEEHIQALEQIDTHAEDLKVQQDCLRQALSKIEPYTFPKPDELTEKNLNKILRAR